MLIATTDQTERIQSTQGLQDAVAVISARGLGFSFGAGQSQKQILFDVDVDIWPGEIVMLTVPSGSGKTTLLSLIGGLRTVRQAQLTVLGQELHGAAPQALVPLRRKIGFIFQTHNLLEFLTVRRNAEMVVMELRKQLAQRRGCAILIVTHDNRVLDVADRVIRMEDGQILTPCAG